MEFKTNIPIYLQVIQDIKTKIIKGELPLGSKLPSSRELAILYNINPNTAARIYNELEGVGISYTKRGIGTFIKDDPALIDTLRNEHLENVIMEFTEQVAILGYSKEEIINLLDTFYKRHP